MSAFLEFLTLPGHRKPQTSSYFRSISHFRRASNSRSTPSVTAMDPPSPAPSASAGLMCRRVASPALTFPASSESPGSTDLTRGDVPTEMPTELEHDQEDVDDSLPDRPRLPSGPADWEAKKDIIRKLYMDKNMILNEVIEIMITKYKFKATARMYKGQFAKWNWTKYNKSGNPSALNATRSRGVKKNLKRKSDALVDSPSVNDKAVLARAAPEAEPRLFPQLLHFGIEDWQVESTLNAYATLISQWSERETPWRVVQGHNQAQLFEPQNSSILQLVRLAQGYFLTGQPQLGGEKLRSAFLGIEHAVNNGLNVEALWDCCLAVPQLVLAMGWTDILRIFAKFLYQLTSIKLPGHPMTKIAESLYQISRQAMPHWQLQVYVNQGWMVWIDCLTRIRGRHDDVTIHLKRGYVTLINPGHSMAKDILCDFGHVVRDSIAGRGAPATTSRILELEHLLVRMFVPLFTSESAGRAKVMLANIATRVQEKPGNRGVPVTEWDYLDRYLVFSAHHFLAAIFDECGESHIGAGYRRRCLDSPRDIFWIQTSQLLEQQMRAEGNDLEADGIKEERARVQLQLENYPGEFRLIG